VNDAGFLEGFLIGVRDSKPTHLSRSKKGMELGRACAYAMKIKAFAEHYGIVALLQKDNFFFGNNPNEVTSDKSKVQFFFKSKMRIIFRNSDIGMRFYNIIHYLMSRLCLTQFDKAEDILSNHVMGFDDYYTSLLPKIYSKNKRNLGEVIGVRRPKIPSASPVLSSLEMKLISDIAKPFWGALDSVKREWKAYIMTGNFGQVSRYIQTLLRTRQDFLQKFASFTTFRLKNLRKFLDENKLIKAKVTEESLRDYLTYDHELSRRELRDGLVKIFGAELSDLIRFLRFEKGLDITDKEYLSLRINECHPPEMYDDDQNKIEWKWPEIEISTDLQDIVEQARSSVYLNTNRVIEFQKELYNTINFRNPGAAQESCKKAIKICSNLVEQIEAKGRQLKNSEQLMLRILKNDALTFILGDKNLVKILTPLADGDARQFAAFRGMVPEKQFSAYIARANAISEALKSLTGAFKK
jgi:hypothetical protein